MQSDGSSPELFLALLEKTLSLSTGFSKPGDSKPGMTRGDFVTKSVETELTETNMGESRIFDEERQSSVGYLNV